MKNRPVPFYAAALRSALAGLGVLAFSACAADIGEQSLTAKTLDDVEVPGDFTFAATRALTLRGAGTAAALASTLAEVRLPNGELVHKGALNHAIRIAVPLAETSLEVTLRTPSSERTLTLPVTGDDATVPVE